MARKGARGNRGPKGDKGDPGASQSLYLYNATTGLSGYPGDGAIGWSHATQIDSTALRVSHFASDGKDIDLILAQALAFLRTTIAPRHIRRLPTTSSCLSPCLRAWRPNRPPTPFLFRRPPLPRDQARSYGDSSHP